MINRIDARSKHGTFRASISLVALQLVSSNNGKGLLKTRSCNSGGSRMGSIAAWA